MKVYVMNLNETYYMDLWRNYDNIGEAYDKYYKQHTGNHWDKSVSRQRFTARIKTQSRSVWRAIETPHSWKPSERTWNQFRYEWTNKKSKKPSLSTYRARRNNWMSVEESFCLTPVKSRSKRHESPEPKCRLATYYTRRARGFTHEQAISHQLMRAPVIRTKKHINLCWI